MGKTKKLQKSYIRENFASVINEVKDGSVFYISDRGAVACALVPIKLLEKLAHKSKKITPISETKAFGMFSDRKDMKDSVKWVRKVRSARLRRIHG